MGLAKPLAELKENEFDGQLFRGPKALATRLGWQSYHVLHSRGGRPGFPDRVAWRERTIFVETKTMKGAVSEHQVAMLTSLAKAGNEVFLWRPDDLDEAARVLAGHWVFDAARGVLWTERDQPWQPASLWLPAGCRADQAVQMRL
jgi:hypothetical protein